MYQEKQEEMKEPKDSTSTKASLDLNTPKGCQLHH